MKKNGEGGAAKADISDPFFLGTGSPLGGRRGAVSGKLVDYPRKYW